MKIWYHGTNEIAAASILKTGFRSGTFFAAHLEDAIAFGGPHVFEVPLDRHKDNWQLVYPHWVHPAQIVAYTVFKASILFDNPELRMEVFEANKDGSIDGLVGKIGPEEIRHWT